MTHIDSGPCRGKDATALVDEVGEQPAREQKEKNLPDLDKSMIPDRRGRTQRGPRGQRKGRFDEIYG